MGNMYEINDDMSLAVAKAMGDTKYISEVSEWIEVPETLDGLYKYIAANYLISPQDRLSFGKKVREIYIEICETLYDEQADMYPSVSEIATIIDEENLLIIDNYFVSYGITDKDIEICKTKYVTDISCCMYGEIKSYLRDNGLYYRRDDIKVLDEMELVSGTLNPDQQILIYDFFY